MASLASRYRGGTVEVILEEGSSDDDDFIEQEARLAAEEQHGSTKSTASRPRCEGEEQQTNAYGEAMAILDQAALACDREFAINNNIPVIVESSLLKNNKVTIEEVHDMDWDDEDVPITARARPDPSDDIVLPTLAKNQNEVPEERVMSPSDNALDNGQLFPCTVCGRTFLEKALERHSKVCAKVSTKKRNVFDLTKKRLEGLDSVPASKEPPKRKIVKAEDEFQQCPSCQRKFGEKAYDRHVQWCMEKARRIQASPKKDVEALAKLQARIAYRPKTPNRKESSGSGGSPSRKASNTSVESMSASPDFMSRSFTLTRSDSRNENRKKSISGTKSLGRAGGISFLKDVEHTKETQETAFIRASTGRGSIKRGPAPTKASVLRQQKTSDLVPRSKTPNCPLHNPGSMTPTLRRRAPSPANSVYGSLPSRSDYSFKALVKPSVVRPNRSSYGMRREPEGIEHESTPRTSRPSSALMGGHYDHSQEYDPYQSAARQMQELLFGTASKNEEDSANLRPSTNSAFQKYIPSANVPSTADINNKLSSNPVTRRTSWENNKVSSWTKPGFGETHGRMAAKVAKFCHECGNPFSLPDIRFCCECGVKRLYM